MTKSDKLLIMVDDDVIIKRTSFFSFKKKYKKNYNKIR
jgi:hypothetical protein